MRAPGHWAYAPERPGLAARLLSPVAAIWALSTARRVARPPKVRPGVPVICVGNLTAGGTGKTPVVSALLEHFASRGVAAHALSRGYGGRLEGPVRVDLHIHTAAEVGDEPLLLAGFGPAWVSRDRAAGAEAAAANGAEVIILDDGFQNPDVAKDLSLLVVDAEAGFGNGRVIPAGPLREPVAAGLKRADLVLLMGPEAARRRVLEQWPVLREKPLAEGSLQPLPTGMPWQGLRCLAFAGIGRPEKFFASLRGTGAEVVETRSFPDHAAYSRAIVERLLREAAQLNAQPVTTEKDAVRLPPDLRPKFLTLPVRLALAERDALDAALDRITP